MWEVFKRNNVESSASNAVVIETLEERQFMSVVHPAIVAKPAPKPAPVKPAVVVAAKPIVKAAAKPAAKAAPAAASPQLLLGVYPVYTPAPVPSMAPDCVGNWSGTATEDGSKTGSPMSVNFAFQRGLAVSGSFNLGAAFGNKTIVSTMVFSANKTVRILFSNSTTTAGFTGSLSSDGKTIRARYSNLAGGVWHTGTLILTRN